MIEKIIKIQNVGKFVNSSSHGDTTFRRLTLIHANNGQGKTTLSAILRSLCTGEGKYIQERCTLGQDDKPSISLRIGDITANFTDLSWDNTLPDMEIFDPTFVDENVYAGFSVEHDHKRNLYQFAIMGNEYSKYILKKGTPKVGLLNIGEEEHKGNDLTKKTYEELKKAPINFVGNVEGRDIFNGKVDVIVCDGFVGNTLLKFAESINAVYTTNLTQRIGKRLQYKFGAYLMKPAFRRLKKTFDYAEYGGVPLLGINGVVIIGHGGSSSKAICNAIFEAEKIINENVNENIEQELARIENE